MKNDVSKVLGRQRKVAGAYARYEFNKRYMLAFLIIGIALGLLIYPSFYNLIILIGLELFPNAVMAALACLIVLAVVLSARQINKTWFVGYLAEKQVGDCLESLLTRNNYAVAHNVDSLIAGDIDHLVATPTELWVIETKYRRLPAKKFREALQKLQTRADCVK